MKSLYDAINQFWTETEVSPLPPSACALYHFLCYKANRQRWQMPVKCSTNMMECCLQISRPTICVAREKLAARGLISYVKGKRKNAFAEYTILDKQAEQHELTQDANQQGLTPDLTPDLTQGLTPKLTQNFTINNKKNKEEEKENNISNNNNAREEKISLKELEEKLSADAEWLNSVSAFIASCGFGTLNEQQVSAYLHSFFLYLTASGQNERKENDTRRYFNNWLRMKIKKQTNNNGNNTKETTADRRRSFDIGTTSEKNYHSSL